MEEQREAKSKGERERYTQLNTEFQKVARRDKKAFFNDTRDDSTHGHRQMVNTEIKLITFFVAEDGEAVCSQQKQAQELTVA